MKIVKNSITPSQEAKLKDYIAVLKSGKYHQIKDQFSNGRGGYCAVGLLTCPDLNHISPYYAEELGLMSEYGYGVDFISKLSTEGKTFQEIAFVIEYEMKGAACLNH